MAGPAGAVTDLLDELSAIELVALVSSYQKLLNAIAEITGQMVRDEFLNLPNLRDANLAEFATNARPIIRAARNEGVDLASALVEELAGARPKVVDLRFPATPFEHPFLRTWHELKEGKSFDEARISGAKEAESVGRGAPHVGAQTRMANTGLRLVGARRVLSVNPCEWCQVASIQRYHSIDTASFGHGGRHTPNNCQCVVVGIYGKRDPGKVLNRTRLAEARASGAIERVSENRGRRSPAAPDAE